jgi:hypothetical protein
MLHTQDSFHLCECSIKETEEVSSITNKTCAKALLTDEMLCNAEV